MTFSKQAVLMQIPQAGLLKSPAGQHAPGHIFFLKVVKSENCRNGPKRNAKKVWQTESDHQHQ